jgi:hypothetical protein
MNKDAHLIFEAYKKQTFQILNEAPPVGFDEPFAQKSPEEKQQQIKDVAKEVQFPPGAKGKYDLDVTQTEQVIAGVEAKLKEMGGATNAPYKFFQENTVAEIVRQVAPAIKVANSRYTARVVYNAMRKGKILKDETTGFGGGVAKDKGYSSAAGKRKLAEIIVADPEKFEGEEVNELESAAPEASQDAATTRIANWAFEEIDPVAGAPEQDVITSIQRKILSSGGLGMEEKSIVSKIKAVLNILVSSKVIERKAGKLIFGSNFDKFETASEDTSNIGKDPLTIAQELGLKGSSENQKYQRGADYWSVQPN